MKRIIYILFVILIVLILPIKSFAEENKIDENEIMNSQKASLDINGFIKQAKKYTEDVFKDTDYNELLNSAIKGDINNEKIGKSILNIVRKRNNRFN